MILPAGSRELIDEFRLYPEYGDLRKVRPTIRAMEIGMWGVEKQEYKWSAAFWEQCRVTTSCIVARPQDEKGLEPGPNDIVPLMAQALRLVSEHWMSTTKTTAVDAVHEGAFAFVLYAIRCLAELVGNDRQRVAGRLLLRTIVECHITLAYLINKNDPALWTKFRHYGSGQAKLALLKISEAANPPHSVSEEKLERLANEDMWDEFVDINLGNWAGADLRKMAEESGTKQIYDTHYGWASAHTHGQWSALRDTSLATCLNPLHRLHRVPAIALSPLADTVPDAIDVVEAMITNLLKLFPGPAISLRSGPLDPPDTEHAKSQD